MSPDEYNYGVARIRALEARMLTPAQTARMSAAPDFQSAFAVLSETTYSEKLPRLKIPFDFEELFELELISLKQLFDRLAPANELITALFKKYDFLNLKTIMRDFILNDKNPGKYSRAGTIDPAKLNLFVFEGIRDFEDKNIVKAVEQIKAGLDKNTDAQLVDNILDKSYYKYLKHTYQTCPSPLVQNLANHIIDLINIKIVLRTKELNQLKEFLLEPGLIDKDILIGLFEKSGQDIITKLSYTPYLPALASGLEYLGKNNSFYLLEKLMDNFTVSQFKTAKYISSGIEPLVGFYLAKENEIKTLRFILISQKSNISTEQIKERLRLSYV
ncbi:MAG: V-type ATPase subunit [Candidatus Margulisbacteria bacterium]|nr:V-type ATPase subunit [Candidatus Margulisiibacteriota bacterium]